ncbi:MAG: hypothetical protein ACI9VR_000830 [Cognaticolwellia sp.]
MRLRATFTKLAPHLAIALALALLLTWPAVLDLRGSMLGHPGNDTWNHAWGFWWVADSLGQGQLPLHTDLLDHPQGGALFFIDSFNALWTWPIQVLAGVPAALNLAVIFAFFCNGIGAWALGRRVLDDEWLAWVPGVIFAASAHLLGQAYNGITETLNAGFLPLYLLLLLRMLDRPSLARAAAMGAALALCSVANFYYGLFGIVLSVVVVLHRAISEPLRTGWKGFALALGGSVLLYAVLVLPVLAVLSQSMDAADALVDRDPAFVWASLVNHNITDVVSMFRPGKHYSPDLKAQYGEDLLIVTYLGWVSLALAAGGLVAARPKRSLGLWIALAVVFLLFALGPYLHVGGEYLTWKGRRIPLPFLAFFQAFPLFSRISHPFRFVVPATLGLGMLAGLGAQALSRRWPALPRPAIAGILGALVLSEVTLASPAVWPLPRCDARIPSAYTQVSQGAILDLPITVPNLERAVYTWYQTEHGQPVPYGLNEPVPETLADNPLTELMVRIESAYVLSLPPMLPELELVAGARRLQAEGYGRVVVHEELYLSPKLEMVSAVLEGLFGPPHREGGMAVYQVQPPADGSAAHADGAPIR